MPRPTNLFAFLTLGVLGIMLADLVTHPSGTNSVSNGIVAIEKPGINGLLGKSS